MSRPPAPAALAGLLASAALLAGCGTPPELRSPSGTTTPVRRSPTPPPSSPALPTPPPALPTPTAATPSFGELTAVDCRGRPSAAQVTTLLRRTAGLVPPNASVTVRRGPLCAGDWHYTEIRVPDSEPLQVVGKGSSASLTLVTAGTNVCGIPVRTAAPAGIRALACEAPSAPWPGT